MKYKIILLAVLNILRMNPINAKWTKVENDLSTNWVLAWAIDACDSNCVVISVNDDSPEPSKIYKTDNGGISWINISPIKTWGESIIDISIIDELDIWGVSDSWKNIRYK